MNCSIPFLLHPDTRNQQLQIDPGELYYNPLTKTLHRDRFSGGIPSLIEGDAIQLTTANNSTEIDVQFDENTEVITSLGDTDTLLVSNTQNELKTITALKLKEDIRLTPGDNLEFGTGLNVNKLSLKKSITNTYLNSGSTWNGALIAATKIGNGTVSNTNFQRLSHLTSAILQSSNKGAVSGVCPLDSNSIIPTQYLPSSVNDIIEVSNFSQLPVTGESSKIYVTVNDHKAYRWSGTAYVEISSSLVMGTTTGTVYDGWLDQQNATAIASKQATLIDSSTSGILIDASNNINIDMTRTNAETSFDDNELMIIQKSNGSVCRITKQQL